MGSSKNIGKIKDYKTSQYSDFRLFFFVAVVGYL